MDYSLKNTIYSQADVREYWIVDPVKERVTVYRYEEDAAPTILYIHAANYRRHLQRLNYYHCRFTELNSKRPLLRQQERPLT